MTRERKRVLWLLNHSTLRDCEVPLLMKLGMEVFIPKAIPQRPGIRSLLKGATVGLNAFAWA